MNKSLKRCAGSKTAFSVKRNTERYRSGHNEAVLKTVCPKGTRVRIPSSPPKPNIMFSSETKVC